MKVKLKFLDNRSFNSGHFYSCSPLHFYVGRGRRWYTYRKWKLDGPCWRDWRALSECDGALYAHDAKWHGWKLRRGGFPFPLRLLLTFICKEMSRGEARVFVLRKSQIRVAVHFTVTIRNFHTTQPMCPHDQLYRQTERFQEWHSSKLLYRIFSC